MKICQNCGAQNNDMNAIFASGSSVEVIIEKYNGARIAHFLVFDESNNETTIVTEELTEADY